MVRSRIKQRWIRGGLKGVERSSYDSAWLLTGRGVVVQVFFDVPELN